MQILNSEEALKIKVKHRGNLSPAYYNVLHLQVNQSLLLSPSDWNRKEFPGRMVRRIMKKHSRTFTVATLLDKSGWLITRIS